MKTMVEGLIKNSKAAYNFMIKYKNVLPIWGIQTETEIDEFLEYQKTSPKLDKQLLFDIEKDKKELTGDFCRGCGYCMPCPQDIEINSCVRMSLWIRRFPTEPCLTQDYQNKMNKSLDCIECNKYIEKCSYELDIPQLLKENYEDYINVFNWKNKDCKMKN